MRAGDTKEQIVEAALALVAERGFAATSVDDIAAAAGVAKGSVFYNFGSKAGLFESIISQGVARLTEALRAAAEGLHGREALEALVTELLTQIQANPDFAKLMAAESFRTGRSWQDSIQHLRDESIGTFADVVGGHVAGAQRAARRRRHVRCHAAGRARVARVPAPPHARGGARGGHRHARLTPDMKEARRYRRASSSSRRTSDVGRDHSPRCVGTPVSSERTSDSWKRRWPPRVEPPRACRPGPSA